jgi:hypothetical protein
MIWASALRLFFIRNLLDPAGEKILLMNPVNRGGDYHSFTSATRSAKNSTHSAQFARII